MTKYGQYVIIMLGGKIMKLKIQLGDMKIDFETPAELKSKLELKLKEIEERLLKLGIETKQLSKQKRAIKKALVGLSSEKTLPPHTQNQ